MVAQDHALYPNLGRNELRKTEMATPTETVMAFLAMLEQPGGFAAGVCAFFTDKTNYINVGMSDTTGIEQTLAFIEGFEGATGATVLRVDMLAIAEVGNKVLTERIDHLLAADGTTVMSLAVMGIFEVEDGKLTAWRDYFDTAGIAGAMAG